MLKQLLTVAILMGASLCFAATDVNKASASELDSIKGIGPAVSKKILDERKKGNFKDWNDLIDRVKGIGDGSAGKLSAAGLTVNGVDYKKNTAPAATKSITGSAQPASKASSSTKKP